MNPADLPFRAKSNNCKLVVSHAVLAILVGGTLFCMFGPCHTVGNGVCNKVKTKKRLDEREWLSFQLSNADPSD